MPTAIDWNSSSLGVLTARCPFCRDVVTIEPLDWFADLPCPDCGGLLWPVTGREVAIFLRADAGWNRRALLDLLARLPLAEADSLSHVEFSLIIEEALERPPPAELLREPADRLLGWIAANANR